MIPVGRGILARRYLAAYRRRRLVDGELLDRWLVVRAAARFFEGRFSEAIRLEFGELDQLIRRSPAGR